MKVYFNDLKRVNEPYQQQLSAAMQRVQQRGWFVLGEEVAAFEAEFAAYCDTKYCLGLGNGLDALRLILEGYKCLGCLKEGDKVLVSAHTMYASWLAIQQAGLQPIPIEPDPDLYTLDPKALPENPPENTKVLLVVQLYGQCADMDALRAYADLHGLLLIEDAAQAHGARFRNKKAGSLSDAAAFSFYPTKNLGALGDGGALTTSDQGLAEVVQNLRNYGSSSKNVFAYAGINSRLDELQAAFLHAKLPSLDNVLAEKQQIAEAYLEHLQHLPIGLPKIGPENFHSWHLFVIKHPQRDKLKALLLQEGIETSIHYPIPPHRQAIFQQADWKLPITDRLSNEVLSLPIYPGLRDEEIKQVCTSLESALAKLEHES